MSEDLSGNLPTRVLTVQLAIRSDPKTFELLKKVLNASQVRDAIEAEVESVLLYEVAEELGTETPEDIDIEWVKVEEHEAY